MHKYSALNPEERERADTGYLFFKPTPQRPPDFQFNGTLRNLKVSAKRRFSRFVLIPAVPRWMNEKESSTKRWMSAEDHELIQIAESTLLTLRREKSSGKVCPRVLFFDATPEEDEVYAPHQLKTYLRAIAAEKQYTLEFHIAAHGDPDRMGSMFSDTWMPIEKFAEELVRFLRSHDPEETAGFKKRSIHFTFHCCNSAYCSIDSGMSTAEIGEALKTKSLIGKFLAELKGHGFCKVSATGFRGYYSHTTGHSGSMVSSSIGSSVLSLPAESAKFTIKEDGTVELPGSERGRFLGVDLYDLRRAPHLP